MAQITKANSEDAGKANAWIAVGQHVDRTALKRTAAILRARWAGRYDFRISESDVESGEWELFLRHR